MLREKRVAEEEFARIDQDDDAGHSEKRGGTCILGVLCVIGVIVAVALLAPARAMEPVARPVLELVR
ncbi:hypothetical protein [Phyllobacterium zundukense]|uniref:Uncharacterized protein n=1 Tax=Phyllobacterium zundukense TaxID=1867719 RepID=A0A2N9W292_9HYPH|nr:hypothetical protein [Phyllobacterium zundukense]ATU91171.1 hypothetical protein BLM14_05635 [Phyllobacterium zundukense]PIO45860.1 hypothetical protein B5P45_04800 [Phyllobacterium zundukense]